MKESKHQTGKPFDRAGFQKDGSFIQQISRRTENADGKKGWYPPKTGQRVITRSGPLKIERVLETFEFEKKKYFRAEGKLIVEN